MARIRIAPIIPKKMNIALYRVAVTGALQKEGQAILKSYKRISDRFETPVSYDTKMKTKFNMSITVSTSDRRMVFLDLGTSTRWAVMSSGFSPKTTPRRISSRRGAGPAGRRGRAAVQARGIAPRPGIKAREFSITIAKQRKKSFATNVQRAINKAAKNTF